MGEEKKGRDGKKKMKYMVPKLTQLYGETAKGNGVCASGSLEVVTCSSGGSASAICTSGGSC